MMLLDLIREVDPNEQWSEDMEGVLLKITNDFFDSVVTIACQLLLNCKPSTLEVKCLQLHPECQ